MALRIGDEAPDFTAETTQGEIEFHDWMGDHWALLFSHPKDFTPVCTTELGTLAQLKPEFDKRDCKLIGLSADTVEDHQKWTKDIEETSGAKLDFPLIGDGNLEVARLYDMIHPNANGPSAGRTAQDNATVRSVFLIGPDKKIKFIFVYPMSAGRNFQEILRAIDAVQLASRYTVATPAGWKPGDEVIIPPSVTDEAAKAKYPQGWKTLKSYLRMIPQPK